MSVLLAASVCASLAACDGGNTTPETTATPAPEATEAPVPTEAAVDNGTSNTMTDNLVSVTVSTNKTSYEAGEKVYYTIKVENNHELYALNKATLEYKNTKGLKGVNNQSMPKELPMIYYGESYEIHGVLVGDEATFPVTGELPADVTPEYSLSLIHI